MESTRATSTSMDEGAIDELLRVVPGVPMAVVTRDGGVLLNANQPMAELLGLPMACVIGRSIVESHVSPDQRSSFLRQIEGADDRSPASECQLKRADGKHVWVSLSVRPIGYRGAPALLTSCHDITAQKDLERQLAETEGRLARHTSELASNELRIQQRAAEAANRAKSSFLANMSHELRSPLNSILGFSEMIRDLHFGRDRYEKYIQYGGFIHQAGTHLLALIDDILDLAKVESGKLKLNKTSFNLAELLNECTQLVRLLADRRELRLTIDAPAGLLLTADRLRTKQMVINLLSNAIKFTLPGGSIAIAARTTDRAIELTIADTGVGMTPQETALALEPFGRTDSAAVNDPTGTGLGLSIVQKLIEAHGGRFEIESVPGRGTVTRLVFPIQP
jgi:PAS domain S-box-containing protein